MRYTIIITSLLILSLLTGCKKSIEPHPVLPDTISFKNHIIPIFNQYCNNPGCHSGSQPQGSLNLSPGVAHAQLLSKSMIDTLQPDHSLLYAQMNSSNKPMPPSGKLDTFYLKEVLRWIEQGAKDN
jgi:hypothetical protein